MDMITNYPPFTIIHPRGSYLNHRINHAGTGLLCGKPLPARLDVPDIDNGKPDCRACSRRWSAIQDAADNRLRRAGCRCYYPARVWIPGYISNGTTIVTATPEEPVP